MDTNGSGRTTNADGELLLFWSLPVIALIWVAAFLTFPGFVHPMSPTMSAEQVAAFYRDPANLPRASASAWLCSTCSVSR